MPSTALLPPRPALAPPTPRQQDIDNTDAQGPTAFKVGQYALGNLLYTPVPNAMFGGELQWGRRENLDGFHSDGLKLQFSFKYNFAWKLGG